MKDTDPNEQRIFSRIPFDSEVIIVMDGESWKSTLLDISLKGALVNKPNEWKASIDDPCLLEISLGKDTIIKMEARVAHLESKQIGFRCENIDLESISHLRRIVELNTSDEDLLTRELHALTGK